MEGEFLFFLLFLIHLWKSHLSTGTGGYCFILFMFPLDLAQQILGLEKHLDHAVFKLSDAFFILFFFHVLPLPEADRGFWGCFSVCHFWARVTSSVIRITYPNCCYFTVSKNVPLKIPYKYFTSSNKEGLWTAFSLFNRRKHLLQPGKNPPTSAKRVCWTLCTGLILSLDKLQCIRVCWQRDKPFPWGSI